ncbi:MAG: nucleotidyl transferase AbiEii/AbiGii toxin family protein [Dehalococcoidia bacterium]|nr:nucleotidyl transferase AbiEii/AbiGii toxin family protein [Dehalococcoidia bacterium]
MLKLHAYTRRYEGAESGRPKDLVDLALIAQLFSLDAARFLLDLREVFASRGNPCELPSDLPSPPAEWRVPYRQLALEVGLDADLNAGHTAAAAMLDSVLQGKVQSGAWNPQAQRWDG